MAAVQQLLFPDPRPLVERLGGEFFRSLPTGPGVYIMRNLEGIPVYIGKAKNLRKRLAAYRVANPGRMKRRHLRLLGSTVEIDIELCVDEEAALVREAELILLHRPRFNRAGTWPAVARFVAWRMDESRIEFRVVEQVEDDWSAVGPLGSGRAVRYRAALVRLLWIMQNTGRSLTDMPCGWIHGCRDERVCLEMTRETALPISLLQKLADGSTEPLSLAVRSAVEKIRPNFALELIENDLERIARNT